MKALILTSNHTMKVENISQKKLMNNQVRIKVYRAGICGTDIKIFQGEYFKSQNSPKEIVLGHEFVGEITEKGSEVIKFNVGDRVTAHSTMETCGECKYCYRGEFNLCSKKMRVGFNFNGVFAESVIFNEDQLYLVPKEISNQAAVLIEPISVVARAIYKTTIHPTDSIIITGPGTIGLLTLIVAKRFGANVTVVGISTDKDRLELAKNLGADEVYIFSDEALKKKNEKYDISFECSGNGNAINLALNLLKPKGNFVQVGTSSKKVNIDFMKVAYKEIIVKGSISAVREDWDIAIKLLKEIQTSVIKIIGKELSFDEWEKGFKDISKYPKSIFVVK